MGFIAMLDIYECITVYMHMYMYGTKQRL